MNAREVYLRSRNRALRAAELRSKGLTYRKIGEEMGGISIETARQAVLKGRRLQQAMPQVSSGADDADGMTAKECRAEVAKLIHFFRREGYSRFGHEGDVRDWSPADTAINAMRVLLAKRRDRKADQQSGAHDGT